MTAKGRPIRICPECGNEITGNFCSNCGFEVKKKAITVKSLFTMFFESKSSLNLKLISTIKALFVRPAPFIANYLRGKRSNYSHPIKYMLLMTGINVGIIASYGINKLEAKVSGIVEPQSTLDYIVEKYGQFFYVLFIPLFGLFSVILDSKSKYKIAERAVIFTYITGQISLVAIPLNFISAYYYPFLEVRSVVMHTLPLVYLYIIEHYLFRNNIWLAALKAILLMVFLVSSIAIVFGILYIIFPN